MNFYLNSRFSQAKKPKIIELFLSKAYAERKKIYIKALFYPYPEHFCFFLRFPHSVFAAHFSRKIAKVEKALETLLYECKVVILLKLSRCIQSSV